MALVRDWIGFFLSRHRTRFSPPDWPLEGCEEYREFSRGWITAFATQNVQESEAAAASIRLAQKPPKWRNDHLPAVMEQIREIREERGDPGSTREEIEAQSRDCPYCCGCGMTVVFNPKFHPDVPVPGEVGAHCTCPHGRWIRKTLAASKETQGLLRRIPDLQDVMDGRSGWVLEPPGLIGRKPWRRDASRIVQDPRGCVHRVGPDRSDV